jgi:hypothetical protein
MGTRLPNGSRKYLYQQMLTNKIPAYVVLSAVRQMYDMIETHKDPLFQYLEANRRTPAVKYVLETPLLDGATLYKETGVPSAKVISEWMADFYLKGPEPLWFDEIWATLLNYTELFEETHLNLLLLAKYKNRYKVIPLKPLHRADTCFLS